MDDDDLLLEELEDGTLPMRGRALLQGEPVTRAGSHHSSGGRSSRIGTEMWLRTEEMKRQRQIATLRQVEEQRQQEECTFRPEINRNHDAEGRRQTYGGTFNRLGGNQRMVYEKREELKRQKEDEEQSRFSFRPVLSTKSRALASKRRVTTKGEVESLSDKLFNDARIQECKMRKRVKEKTEQELAGLFHPQITERSPSGEGAQELAQSPVPVSPAHEYAVSRKPLHERLDEIKKQKAAKMIEIRQKYLEEEAHSFKPTLCPRSRSIEAAHEEGQVDDFAQRSEERCRHASSRELQKQRMEREGVKTVPHISSRSREIVSQSRDFVVHSDFVQRQQYLNRQREHRMRSIKEEMERSERPKATKPRTQQHVDTVVSQLHGHAEKKRTRMEDLARESVEGYFKPRISQRSGAWFMSPEGKRGGGGGGGGGGPVRSASASMAYHRGSRTEDCRRILDEREQREARDLTFRPNINGNAARLASRRRQRMCDSAMDQTGGSAVSQVTYYGRDPEVEREVTRRARQQEMEKFEQCTFEPAILPEGHAAASQQDVCINGFQQFVERQERARREELDKKKRETEVHRVKPSAKSNVKERDKQGKLITVVEPFKLSTGVGRTQRTDGDKYTYKPRTNESNRDRVLERVLEEMEDDEVSGVTDGRYTNDSMLRSRAGELGGYQGYQGRSLYSAPKRSASAPHAPHVDPHAANFSVDAGFPEEGSIAQASNPSLFFGPGSEVALG